MGMVTAIALFGSNKPNPDIAHPPDPGIEMGEGLSQNKNEKCNGLLTSS
jgi:hypothetical protein